MTRLKLLSSLLSLQLLGPAWRSRVAAFDVLMVIGGRYYDHARNAHIELSSVEVVGPGNSGTCQVADLPESRHGHSAVRLGDSVVVCGGLSGRHIHERKPCYIFSGTTGKWKEIEEPAPAGLAFSGMAAMGNCVYLVGGRENLYTGDNIERNWKHSPGVMEYCTTRTGINAWRFLANLTSPVSDGCAAVVDGRLWLVGGEAGVSVLGPGAHKWREGVAEEPHDYELTNLGLMPALQRPLPEISESPWWEEGQSLSKPPPVSREGGQPGQYWQGQVTGVGGFQRGQADFQGPPDQRYSLPGQGGYGFNNNMGGQYPGGRQGGSKTDFFSSLRSMFGIKTTVRPGPVGGRRYDGNPYSKLRERNKREAEEWRGQITRAPYVNKEQTQGFGQPQQPQQPQYQPSSTRPLLKTNWRSPEDARMNQNIQSQNVPLYNNNYNMNQNVDYLGGQGEQQNRHGYNSYDQGSFPRQTVNTKEKGERKKSRSRTSEEPPKVLPVGQGCHTTYLGAELGVFIAGGFQRNGRRVRWLPLGRPGKPRIEELQVMVEPRRWAPAVGSVGDNLVVAGGGNWGTNTIEVFDKNERRWRSGGRLRFRREYGAAVTVDSSWFPQCNFTLP